jgi:hypothetical protein
MNTAKIIAMPPCFDPFQRLAALEAMDAVGDQHRQHLQDEQMELTNKVCAHTTNHMLIKGEIRHLRKELNNRFDLAEQLRAFDASKLPPVVEEGAPPLILEATPVSLREAAANVQKLTRQQAETQREGTKNSRRSFSRVEGE